MTISSLIFVPATSSVVVDPVDYRPQLNSALLSLDNIIGAIQQHDTRTGQNHTDLMERLLQIYDVTNRHAADDNANNALLLASLTSIRDAVNGLPSQIEGFFSAEIQVIQDSTAILKAESDETQVQLQGIANQISTFTNTVTAGLTPLDEQNKLTLKRESVSLEGKRFIISPGAIGVSAYFCEGSQSSSFFVTYEDETTEYKSEAFDLTSVASRPNGRGKFNQITIDVPQSDGSTFRCQAIGLGTKIPITIESLSPIVASISGIPNPSIAGNPITFRAVDPNTGDDYKIVRLSGAGGTWETQVHITNQEGSVTAVTGLPAGEYTLQLLHTGGQEIASSILVIS